MSGPIAIETAKANSDSIFAVIGIDTTYFQDDQWIKNQSDWLAALEKDFQGTIRSMVQQQFTHHKDNQDIPYILATISSQEKVQGIMVYKELINWIKFVNIKALKNFPSKLMHISAEQSKPWLTPDSMILEKVPSFKNTFVPNVGHFLMIENKAAFNTKLKAMVDELSES